MRKQSQLRSGAVRVVAFGGGTGLSTLLRGLKEYVAPHQGRREHPITDLTAVVTVTDDGGSSGRLRNEYRVLPPGDIRNCMVALSNDEHLLSRLFQYRFPAGPSLGGHSFGNLFLTALTDVTGDFPEAVRLSSEVLAIRGRIFPSTDQNVTLQAQLENGCVVTGETKISRSTRRIHRVQLVPRRVRPLPEVLKAIRSADLVLVGPGSLYTSIIPNLMVRGMVDAIRRSRAACVYIANLMTQPGETQGYSVADHVRAIYAHTKARIFDWVVVSRLPISRRILRRYHAQGAEPVRMSLGELQSMGLGCVTADLLQQDAVVRHDPERLARLLINEFVAPRNKA